MTRFERWTLYSSAIAAILSIIGLVTTSLIGWSSLQTQKTEITTQREQLDESRKQFEKSGNVIEIKKTQVFLRANDSGRSSLVDSNTRISVDSLSSSSVFVRVDVVNTGRAPGQVEMVGVSTGTTLEDFQSSPNPRCPEAECLRPQPMQPGDKIQMEFQLTDEMKRRLTCNGYAERAVRPRCGTSNHRTGQFIGIQRSLGSVLQRLPAR
ncbi:hypothetical protein V6V47_10740 [Micromonospora sp. CPCC 205539]|uniref:hypothetical protein n=1 Tax=Micromonospora sp. CPCC 205539 TaxID=3122408 RepID=UPI002FEFA48B